MTTAKLVERALQGYPKARSSDRILIMVVWWLQDSNYHTHFKDFFREKAIMPDSITRCRRKFQQNGQYLATEKVDKERFRRFQIIRESTPRTTNPSQMGLL